MRDRQGAQRKWEKAGRVRDTSRQAEAEERMTNTSLTLPLAMSAPLTPTTQAFQASDLSRLLTRLPTTGGPPPKFGQRSRTCGVSGPVGGTQGQPRGAKGSSHGAAHTGHNVHCAKGLYNEANNDNNDTQTDTALSRTTTWLLQMGRYSTSRSNKIRGEHQPEQMASMAGFTGP